MNLDKTNWRLQKLGSILQLEYGKTLIATQRKGGEIPVYGSAGVVGYHNESVSTEDTLIVARKGSIENVFYSNVPCYPIDTVYYVKQSNCKESLKWVQLFLKKYNLRKLNMATAVPSLNRNIVHNVIIPLPPLAEQKRLAALFQSIDESIEQTEKQASDLRALKGQLLRDLLSEKKVFGNLLTEKDYEIVEFGELAEEISKRVEPNKTALEIYVGLEHLDPNDLKIRRTGVPSDVKGIKFLVYKGDIIFGKRRAYQRKVAVSHFDGICSAHSTVLRAREAVVEKEFLPFFMQSDVFMERAVQISEGSLSPTIKWKVLKTQKFFLPKKEKQQPLVELFKSFDNIIELLNTQTQTLKQLKQTLLDEILGV